MDKENVALLQNFEDSYVIVQTDDPVHLIELEKSVLFQHIKIIDKKQIRKENRSRQYKQYRYYMKRSPCCKVCCIFSFVYLLTLLLGTILVITAKYGSGMFGQTHYVSFKIAMDSTNLWRFKTHKTMHGFDDVANQSYSQFVYEQDENGTYINVVPENRSAQQFFQLELNQDTDMMLMAVLFNGTAGWQDSQAKIKSFTIANQSDRGKIIMSVSNNDKIWMEIFQPWFNLDFWTSKVAELLPPKSHSIFQGNSGIQRVESIYNESYSNQLYNYSEIWHPVPFTEENSNIPVWFVNMEAVVITSTGSQQKSEDYSVTFRFGDRFCFSPFLIRDFRYQLLTIENVDLCGNLIVDFTGETENVSVKVSNSSVDFLLTRLEKSYTFELGKGSTINITLPDLISQENCTSYQAWDDGEIGKNCSSVDTCMAVDTSCKYLFYGIASQVIGSEQDQISQITYAVPISFAENVSTFTFYQSGNQSQCKCFKNDEIQCVSGGSASISASLYWTSKCDINSGVLRVSRNE